LTFILFYINYFLRSKYVDKIIWVLNNFLTMECYRKLCNKLYWKRLKPGTIHYTTRLWIIILSALSVILLAFFFDPMDPTYSDSPSQKISRLAKFFRKIQFNLNSFFLPFGKVYKHLCNCISFLIPDSNNIFLWRTQDTYLKTSAILI